jgi:tRNA (guanine37-N1)-methyltransferase
MITFHILTIFPKAFESYFNTSLLKRGQERKLLKIKIYDIRAFSTDRHKRVDDRPYGGGVGMVLKAEPIIKAIKSLSIRPKSAIRNSKFVLLSPFGRQFSRATARNWSTAYKNIVLLCGRYEGIDERVKKVVRQMGFGFQEISIGPYVLAGGELPAMVIVDAVSRYLPAFLGKEESLEEKRGSYPVYTRPEILEISGNRYRVPKVLLSGDHKKIQEWRRRHLRAFKIYKS